jgi:hypothetical protein
VRSPVALAAIEVVEIGHQPQVLPPGEPLVNRAALAGHADRSPDLMGRRGDVMAGHLHMSCVCPDECR